MYGMTARLTSVRDRLEIDSRSGTVAFTVAVLVALIVAVATSRGLLLPFAAVTVVALAFVLGLRWPLLLLALFIAVVPLEEVVQFGGFGTPSRIIGLLFAVAYLPRRVGHVTLRAMPLPAWAFLAWACLSLVWATDRTLASSELETLVQLFVIAVLVADVVVHTPDVVRPLLWAYALAAALTAVVGCLQVLSSGAVGARIAAFQGQDEAQFAAVLLPAFVFAFLELLGRRHVAASFTVALLCAIGIVLSGTRGAWLSVVVVLVLFVLPRLRTRQRVAALVAAALFIVVAVQLPGVSALVSERTDTALSTGGSGRVVIWSVGLEIMREAPLTGVGFANYPVAFTPERILSSGVEVSPGVNRAPHSIILGTAGELGLVGIVLLAAFLVPLLARRGWGQDAVVVQAALASVMTAGLFLDILNRKQVWVLLGMAAGLAYLRRRDRSPAARPEHVRAEVAAPFPTST